MPSSICTRRNSTDGLPRRLRNPRTVDLVLRGQATSSRLHGVGRLYITVAEARCFLASAKVTQAEVRSDG